MSLIRGWRGLCPCPICLVPHTELLDTSKTHPRRTQDGTQDLIKTARGMNKTAGEQVLKSAGLRDVDVWSKHHSIPHHYSELTIYLERFLADIPL